MSISSGPPHSFGNSGLMTGASPHPEATARPPRAVAIGEIAYIHADKGFLVNLPDRTQKHLAGTLALILDERFDTVAGNRSRSLLFCPIPWDFPASAYPSAWWAVEEYFYAIER
jgi:hypothetical protein